MIINIFCCYWALTVRNCHCEQWRDCIIIYNKLLVWSKPPCLTASFIAIIWALVAVQIYILALAVFCVYSISYIMNFSRSQRSFCSQSSRNCSQRSVYSQSSRNWWQRSVLLLCSVLSQTSQNWSQRSQRRKKWVASFFTKLVDKLNQS